MCHKLNNINLKADISFNANWQTYTELKMKVLSFVQLLSLLVYQTAATRQRYVIMHPVNHDPLLNLADANSAIPETIMHTDTYDFSIANLTSLEAATVTHDMKAVKGLITVDEELQLPEQITTIANHGKRSLRGRQTDNVEYLNDAPKCNEHVDKVDFVVIDSQIYKDIPEFAGVDIIYGQKFVDTTVPCLAHGSMVASVIVGKKAGIITSGDRRIYNPIVFDCTGHGFVSGMVGGFNDAMKFAATNLAQGRQTIINHSGASTSNPIADAAAGAAIKANIPTYVAGGNNRQYACNSDSPAEEPGVTAIGGTTFPGNALAWFSNYGAPCIKIYLPGTVTVVNVNVPNGTMQDDGTSFGSPIGAAFAGIEKSRNPLATPAQIEQRTLDRTVTVTSVAKPFGPNFSGPMQVMLQQTACPAPLLFSSLVVGKTSNNHFGSWYQVGNNNTLCMQFDVSTKLGTPMIGLRDNNNSKIVDVTIPRRFVKNNANNVFTLRQDANKTITLMYNAQKQPVITIPETSNMNQIAFGSTARKITYRNAYSC